MSAAQADLGKEQLNPALNEAGLREAVTGIRNAFKLPEYRRVSDPDQKENVRLYGIKHLSRRAVESLFKEKGLPDEAAKRMALGDCFCLRHTIGLYCVGWKWALRGSLPERDDKINNELMDLDQGAIASYCDGVLTREPGVSEIRGDILAVLRSNVVLQ